MPHNNTWAEVLKAYINKGVDWFYRLIAADDEFEYTGAIPDNGKINIEIRLSIKARKR